MSEDAAYRNALDSILSYWVKQTKDPIRGGFYGRILADGTIEPDAPKGSVLNARILWTFSAAYRFDPKKEYLEMATRCYHYFIAHFVDVRWGGVYWSVDATGNPLDTKKQIYALAFSIYGLSEYFAATGLPEALEAAIHLYADIEAHSYDPARGGYLEAFAGDWSALGDLRLSTKDANEKKTMNTHLHILEAYTNLYRVWKDPPLKSRIIELIRDFQQYMIDPHSYHLHLFLDEDWTKRSDTISFGHDIEASWLLLEAGEVVSNDDDPLVASLKNTALVMVNAAREGLAGDGALYYEYEPVEAHWRKEKHWWVQAEAMVGFLNAWQITGDRSYFVQFEKLWIFIDDHIIDHRAGEWVWGLREDNSLMEGEDKVGIWKCPYHNSRALLQVIKRVAEGRH